MTYIERYIILFQRRQDVIGNGLVLAEFPGCKDWWPSWMREILLARLNVLKTIVYFLLISRS